MRGKNSYKTRRVYKKKRKFCELVNKVAHGNYKKTVSLFDEKGQLKPLEDV